MLFTASDSLIVTAESIVNRGIPSDFFIIGPRFLPRGGRLMLAAPTESGKSWISTSVTRSLVLGEPLFGNEEWPVLKSRTLYLESEVGIPLGERFRLVFEDRPEALSEVHVLSQPQGFSLNYPACQSWLRDSIKNLKFDVLILDPIGDLMTSEENSNSDINKLLQIIHDIQGPETAVILTHHTNKAPKGQYADGFDPLDIDNARGASKWNNAVDTFLTLHRRPGNIVTGGDDSWILDARWAKVRHAKQKPPQGVIHFNEDNRHQMIWHDVGKKQNNVKSPEVPWS